MFDKVKYKDVALRILSPIVPVNEKTDVSHSFLNLQKSNASWLLPEYYLIYFLFSDLIGFPNSGRDEKVAWSFAIDYKGKGYLIDFRKFGVGVFVEYKNTDEDTAGEIVKKINQAVKTARPFFDYIAEETVKKSEFSIINNSRELFKRYEFLLDCYNKELAKYQENKGKVEVIKGTNAIGEYTYTKHLDFQYLQNARWVAISCIEAFFSWTEHLFIHLAVVGQNVLDGNVISDLIGNEWNKKYKAAIRDINTQQVKFYDELIIIRQQMRNFIAHCRGFAELMTLFQNVTGIS